jgi:hypothetical protein
VLPWPYLIKAHRSQGRPLGWSPVTRPVRSVDLGRGTNPVKISCRWRLPKSSSRSVLIPLSAMAFARGARGLVDRVYDALAEGDLKP